MLEALQAPLFFGLIAAFVTTLGLLAISQRSDWSERYSGLFGLAAAGMLITVAFLHILPEAFALASNAPMWLAIGFFGGLLLRFGVQSLFPEGDVPQRPAEAITPLIAIAIHSFIDGVVYAVTFAASFESGVYASLGLILHEFPEGVIAFAILRRYGVSNWMSFFWAFAAAAATTPLGVLVAAPFMHSLGGDAIGSLFALSGGLLIYVATGPLMSPLKDTPPVRGMLALSTGIVLAVALAMIPLQAHQHDHIGHDEDDRDHVEHIHSDD